jgi:hypothetical protein
MTLHGDDNQEQEGTSTINPRDERASTIPNLSLKETTLPTTPSVPSAGHLPPNVDKLRRYLNPEERHQVLRRQSPSGIRRRPLQPAPSHLRKSETTGEVHQTKVDPRTRALVLYPDSKEMNWIKTNMGWLICNESRLGRTSGYIFVAPLTNVTCFSLFYQLYLNEIFHTHWFTRLCHSVFMPITNFFIIASIAQFNLFGTDDHLDDSFFAFKPFTVTFFISLLFLLWYFVWGIISKTHIMGVFMTPIVLATYLGANWWVAFNRQEDVESDAWFIWTSFWGSPILWLLVSGFCQALSHLCENVLPPRLNFSLDWLPMSEFIWKYREASIIYFMLGAVCGTLDEIIASPRLLPLYVLHLFYLLGYNSADYAKIKSLAKMAMVYGNPALDFIGTGGARKPETKPLSSVTPIKRRSRSNSFVQA